MKGQTRCKHTYRFNCKKQTHRHKSQSTLSSNNASSSKQTKIHHRSSYCHLCSATFRHRRRIMIQKQAPCSPLSKHHEKPPMTSSYEQCEDEPKEIPHDQLATKDLAQSTKSALPPCLSTEAVMFERVCRDGMMLDMSIEKGGI